MVPPPAVTQGRPVSSLRRTVQDPLPEAVENTLLRGRHVLPTRVSVLRPFMDMSRGPRLPGHYSRARDGTPMDLLLRHCL